MKAEQAKFLASIDSTADDGSISEQEISNMDIDNEPEEIAQIVCDFFFFVFFCFFVFFFHFVFGKRYKFILHLNWVSLRVFLSFQASQGTNLQEIEMS